MSNLPEGPSSSPEKIKVDFKSTNPYAKNNNDAYGSGVYKDEERVIRTPFQHIEILGAMNLTVEIGYDYYLKVEADDNFFKKIKTSVYQNCFKLESKGGLFSNRQIKVFLTCPEVESIAIRGSSNVSILNIKQEFLKASVEGSGSIVASGFSEKVQASINGFGELDLQKLISHQTDVSIDGAGKVSLHAFKSIKGRVNGKGDIAIWGQPEIRDVKINGTGDILYR